MSAELRRVTKTEVWTEWESQVVNGVFPLRRFLGGSDHSAVFLSEYKAANLPDVAIKFVAADSLHAEAAQLVQWGTAVTLSHPHLIRLYDVGRCQFKGRGFLFVVMEYAEQNLAQILPGRTLTPNEARELVLPTIDALAFLHRNQLAHGQLKPSNFLVVNDQLKLASDTVRPIGSSANGTRTSLYHPPELQDAGFSTAGDVWGLGITLLEALTQRAPMWADERAETVALPPGFPLPFVHTVRRCLSRTPANRPSIAELESQYKPVSQAHVTAAPQPPQRETTRETTPPQKSVNRRSPLPGIAAVLLIALGAWVGFRLFQQHSNSGQPTAADTSQGESLTAASAGTAADLAYAGQPPRAVPEPSATPPATAAAPDPATVTPGSGTPAPDSPVPSAPASGTPTAVTSAPVTYAPSSPAPVTPSARTAIAQSVDSTSGVSSPTSRQLTQPASPPAAISPGVLHQVTPDVPRAIRDKIRGHVKVTVRVLVGPSGDVVGEFLESPGPSRYFAHLAGDAAGEWKFAPADTQGPRVWLLRFEFERGGVTIESAPAK
ncbi:MAG: protein kinase domain-containing protein [Steroidobacteraceae bacterium]